MNSKILTIVFFVLSIFVAAACSDGGDFPEMKPKYLSKADLTPEQLKDMSIRHAMLRTLKSSLQKVYDLSDVCVDKVYDTCNTFVGETAPMVLVYEENLKNCVYKILDKECHAFMRTGDIVQRFKDNHEDTFDKLSSKNTYLVKGKVEGFKEDDGTFLHYFSVQDDKERYVQIRLKEKIEVNNFIWVKCRYGEFFFPHQTFERCILIHQQSEK